MSKIITLEKFNQGDVMEHLTWKPVKVPAMFSVNGEMRESPTHSVIYRDDTKEALGIVGSRYQMISHHSVVPNIMSMLSEFGKTSHKISVEGGKIFLDVALLDHGFLKGDRMSFPFIRSLLSYDGSKLHSHMVGIITAVCSNGLTNISTKFSLGFKHDGRLEAKVDNAMSLISSNIVLVKDKYSLLMNGLQSLPMIEWEKLKESLPPRLVDNAMENYSIELATSGMNNGFTQFNAFTRSISHSEVNETTKSINETHLLNYFMPLIGMN